MPRTEHEGWNKNYELFMRLTAERKKLFLRSEIRDVMARSLLAQGSAVKSLGCGITQICCPGNKQVRKT